MAWEKIQPFSGKKHVGCLCCSDGSPDLAPMDMVIAVGFGSACATKGDQTVYDEMDVQRAGGEWGDYATIQDIEAMAAADPDHDWRVMLHGPLRGREYQRHGPAQWVLIDSNPGFA